MNKIKMKGRIRMDNGIKIPEYQLFIHPIDLSELRKDIWIDDPISARLTINKRNMKSILPIVVPISGIFERSPITFRFINQVRIEMPKKFISTQNIKILLYKEINYRSIFSMK